MADGDAAPAKARRGHGRTAALVALSAAVGSFLFGYDTGVIAGALVYIAPEFGLEDDPAMEGLVVAATLVGAFLGSVAGGALGDRFGRRRPLFATAALFVGGGLVMALAPGVGVLIAGRGVVGLAIGVSGAIIPVYIAECAPGAWRGRLATYPQLLVALGIFSSCLVDFAVSVAAPASAAWRLMLGISAVPAIVQFLLLLWLPESPRWLVARGRRDAARAVLQRLREPTAADPELDAELDAIAAAVARDRQVAAAAAGTPEETTRLLPPSPPPGPPAPAAGADDHDAPAGPAGPAARWTWADVKGLLARRDVREALLVGATLQMFAQLSGINATIYYTPAILQAAGVTDLFAGLGLSDASAAILATAITYSLKIPAILVAMQLMDRAGRRRLLLATVPVLAATMAGLAVAFSLDPTASPAAAILSMCMVAVYGCCFAAGLGPIPNILCSEIFPPRARALGLSACLAVQWAFNIAVSQSFPVLVDAIGEVATFSMFAVQCALATAFVAVAVPETKGRALESVADLFADRSIQ